MNLSYEKIPFNIINRIKNDFKKKNYQHIFYDIIGIHKIAYYMAAFCGCISRSRDRGGCCKIWNADIGVG